MHTLTVTKLLQCMQCQYPELDIISRSHGNSLILLLRARIILKADWLLCMRKSPGQAMNALISLGQLANSAFNFCVPTCFLAMSCSRWIRNGLDIANLPRVKLNNIQDLPGAKKKVIGLYSLLGTPFYILVQAIRLGRGPGSRRGKTCGRGHKGQGQRNQHAIRVGFEGGQTPFYLSVPKHGFKNK